MSRIGKQPVAIPEKVEIKLDGQKVDVKGPKGQLLIDAHPEMSVEIDDGQLVVTRPTDERRHRALHGLTRALIANMVQGVSDGFVKELEIQGVGFRAAVKGKSLDLNLGFSHPVLHPIPDELDVTVEENTKIKIEGIDKQLVGQFAADVRAYYPPEPYKGKGVRYKEEYVRRKQGKSVK